MDSQDLVYKVGLLGAPNSSHDGQFTVAVDWSADNIGRLKTLGFNTIQAQRGLGLPAGR